MLIGLFLAVTFTKLIQYAFKNLDKLPNNAMAIVHDSLYTKKSALADIDMLVENFGNIYIIDKQSKLNVEEFFEREDNKPLYEPIFLYNNEAAGGLEPMDAEFTYSNVVEFIQFKSVIPDSDVLLPFVSEQDVEDKAKEIARTQGNITRRHIRLVKEGKMSMEHVQLFTPPQLFFFYGAECEPCKTLEYQFLQYVTKNSRRVVGYTINCDEHVNFCKARDVMGLPALRMYAKQQWYAHKPKFNTVYALDDFVKKNAVKEEDIEYARKLFNIQYENDSAQNSTIKKEPSKTEAKTEKPQKKRPIPVYRNATDTGGDDLRRAINKRNGIKDSHNDSEAEL